MTDAIYLDHNATSPPLPEVADVVREASLQYGANPGSQHQAGRQARRALEDARERIGELLGARVGQTNSDRVIFTSGGTEANNLALLGLLGDRHPQGTHVAGHLITSTIEHPSVLEPAAQLELHGWRVDRVGVDEHGVTSLDQIEQALRPETSLVSLMLANNETGVLQQVAEVAQLCDVWNILQHTDAAQVVGKLPVDFTGLRLAMLSCAAHKFQGPLGIGALVVRHDVPLRATTFGGHQQADLRPGTEMVALACGMCAALECWRRDADCRCQRLSSLRDQLEQTIVANLPNAIVIGSGAKRLPNTSNIAFAGLDRQALVMALDMAGIACSTGSACASGSSELSPTLMAMGVDNEAANGAVRFSLGATTTAAEVAEASRRILSTCHRLRHLGNR